jgi:polar amino acid transport system substrate-binding protein
MDADGSKLTGINGPLITEFAKMECLTLVPHLAQAATELTDVIQHRVDVGDGGWYSTPQRAKVVGQTIPLYYDGWGIVSKGGKYSSISQLMGKPVATISGELMTPILQKVLGSDAMLFDNASDALQAVTTGRAVAWLAGGSEAAYRVNKAGKASGLGFQFLKPTTQLPPSLTPSAVNWPHTKDNAGMTAAMNADIRTMRTNGTVMRALKAYGMQQFFNPPKQ